MNRYHQVFGHWPNLLCPRTFNEHLNRKKLFDRNPLLTTLADKFEVRQYVRDRVGEEYLSRLYLVTNQPEEIDFSLLPARFVIKTTHGSGWNVIITNKSLADEVAIKRQLARWLAQNYYDIGREWCYRNIKPRLIVEEYLGDANGQVPWDYKFFCFNGKARFIQVDFDRFEHHTRNVYDTAWNRIDVAFHYGQSHHQLSAPCYLSQMIRIAEALSQGLDFVRVDLYNIGSQIKFGEMTHYPENGFGQFEPANFDFIFGSYWPHGKLGRRISRCDEWLL